MSVFSSRWRLHLRNCIDWEPRLNVRLEISAAVFSANDSMRDHYRIAN